MSSLAGDGLRYQPPSTFMAETGIMNPFVVQLLWCGLSLDTRRGYTTAIHSYEYFCAFAGFLRLGEFTYETSDRRNRAYFRISHLTSGDSIISETHAILRLRRSKRDYQHHGVTIQLARTGPKTCLVTASKPLRGSTPPTMTNSYSNFSSALSTALLYVMPSRTG
jgi:hypothetical protein